MRLEFHETVFQALDSPSMLYSLAISDKNDVGYVSSRHRIFCFSYERRNALPSLATFFPFDEDSTSAFVPTSHTEILSLQKMTLSNPQGSSALTFVTYTPASDLPTNKSRKILHICAEESEEDQSEESATEKIGSISIDQLISNLHAQYQAFTLTYTPFIMYPIFVTRSSLLPPEALPKSRLREKLPVITASDDTTGPKAIEKSKYWKSNSSPSIIPPFEPSNEPKDQIEEQKNENLPNNTNLSDSNDLNPWKTLLLISGSDEILHGYIELSEEEKKHSNDDSGAMLRCIDGDIIKYLPEIEGIQFGCCVLCMEIKYWQRNRILALGCQDGLLTLTISKINPKNTLRDHKQYIRIKFAASSYLDGPISSIKLVSTSNDSLGNHPANEPSKIYHKLFQQVSEAQQKKSKQIFLLVTSPTGYAILYDDIFKNQLQNPYMLPESDSFDSVTCCCVVQQFGIFYFILGTYSGTLLFYRVDQDSKSTDENVSKAIQLEYTKNVMFPIVGIASATLNPIGSSTIVVNTTGGIHFYELSNEFLGNIILSRLEFFEEIQKLEKEIDSGTPVLD